MPIIKRIVEGIIKKDYSEGQTLPSIDVNTANTLFEEGINTNYADIQRIDIEVDDLEERLNDIIIEAGDSNPEIVDARGGFETLKTRLDYSDTNVNTKFAEAMANANSRLKSHYFTNTIGTTWVGTDAPYTQEIDVTGMLSSYRPFVDVILTGEMVHDTAVLDEWSKILSIESKEGKVLFTASAPTTVDIVIQMEVFA